MNRTLIVRQQVQGRLIKFVYSLMALQHSDLACMAMVLRYGLLPCKQLNILNQIEVPCILTGIWSCRNEIRGFTHCCDLIL